VGGRGGPRLAFVGGGSYQWGPKIIQDIALNEELRGGTLVLHDINGEALRDMYQRGTRALDETKADLKLEKTRRLEEALRRADFVILSISTGGLDATALDLEIPARYGVVQTVGDTVGPGGLFRGLRNIPVIVEIARSMEQDCPDAVLLNLTNPLTVLTRAVTKATPIKAIGLCHVLFSTLGMLSKMFEVPEGAINVKVAGVNHFIWVTDVSVDGRNATGEALRRISGGEARGISLSDADGDSDPFTNTWGFRTELCRLYGYLPAAGDRHVCEVLPGYLWDEKERERLDLRVTTVDIRRKRLAADRESVSCMVRGDEPRPDRTLAGGDLRHPGGHVDRRGLREHRRPAERRPDQRPPAGDGRRDLRRTQRDGGFPHSLRGAPAARSRARPPSRLQPGGHRAGRSDWRLGPGFTRLSERSPGW
jgi:alpha-galactosidase/6-phospho-beta-glucosidase family protein